MSKKREYPGALETLRLLYHLEYTDYPSWVNPSLEDLAFLRGVSRTTIYRHLRYLEEQGYITITRRRGKDGGTLSNVYHVRLLPRHKHA